MTVEALPRPPEVVTTGSSHPLTSGGEVPGTASSPAPSQPHLLRLLPTVPQMQCLGRMSAGLGRGCKCRSTKVSVDAYQGNNAASHLWWSIRQALPPDPAEVAVSSNEQLSTDRHTSRLLLLLLLLCRACCCGDASGVGGASEVGCDAVTRIRIFVPA